MKKKKNEILSEDRKKYLKKVKIRKFEILGTQIFILIAFIAAWELLARAGKIDSFITSQPSRILDTFFNLSSNNLLEHLKITCTETIIGFLLGTTLGSIIAIILGIIFYFFLNESDKGLVLDNKYNYAFG